MKKLKPHINTPEHNRQLSELFRQMSECYQYLGKEERFRAIAYDTASKTLANMKEPVDVYADDSKKLDELKGVGESIAGKIIEFLHTGKIKTFEQLKKKVPYPLLELMDIDGFGPATVKILHQQVHINTKEDLIEALHKNKLEGVKGFGSTKIENMCRALKLDAGKKRIPLDVAEKTAESIRKIILNINTVSDAIIAGSIRRKKETIGDIDIICIATKANQKKTAKAISQLPLIKKIIAAGNTKVSFIIADHEMQVDVRIVTEEEAGAALLYFTGSKEHNIQLRTLARKKGWKINEYGVFDEQTGKRLAGKTEEDIYSLLGYRFIQPENRLGRNELLTAKR
ncbi:MAG: helix-hairpin-helix domain-containing protein [Chitinophagaceae bacterium]